jgi:hypothetical protein
MRNINYKIFSYRLNDKTASEIKQIKRVTNKSYNLLFVDLIKIYKKSHQFKQYDKKIN